MYRRIKGLTAIDAFFDEEAIAKYDGKTINATESAIEDLGHHYTVRI